MAAGLEDRTGSFTMPRFDAIQAETTEKLAMPRVEVKLTRGIL